jgi:hypothetical protein
MSADIPGDAAPELREQWTFVFRKPLVRPGTPEAEAAGCLCRFETNMEAAFLPPKPGHEDEVIVVIKEGCPLHRIIKKPMDDALGDL